jgi:hypothetical protein
MVAVVEKLVYFNAAAQRLRRPWMSEDRHAVATGASIGRADVVGMVMRQHDASQTPTIE